MIVLSEAWKKSFPGACVGFLAMAGVANPAQSVDLQAYKEAVQDELRRRFAGQDRKGIEALPALQAYDAYYKRFKKTYHVQLQLESIAFKGKPIPSVAALVEAMFIAELKNLLLTAGHDLDQVQLPVTVDASGGVERYTVLRGEEQVLKPGDMFMADRLGVISSILYGPDQRTQITPATRRVLFAVYAPAGIGEDAVRRHLTELKDYVQAVAPQAQVEALSVFEAG